MQSTLFFKLLFSFYFLNVGINWAQNKSSQSNTDSTLTTEDVPIITLNTDKRLMNFVKFNDSQLDKFKEAKERAKTTVEGVKEAKSALKNRKHRQKRSEYLGSKVKKGFTKKQRSRTITVERFSFLREYRDPPKLIKYRTYFLPKKRKIVTTDKKSFEGGILLHGKYTKTEIRKDRKTGKLTKVVLEEGHYYRGVKHGRWMKYNRSYVLVDKREYKYGFPAESKISYHDAKKKKLKEILPIHQGFEDGTYFAFYPSGRLKETGQYQEGYKIGKWREFYDTDVYRRKRDIQHPEKPFQDRIESYTIREWNTKGKLVIDNRNR